MKKSISAILLALTISTVLVGTVFADSPVRNQQRENRVNCSENCFRNGEGNRDANAKGLKRGPKDGTRIGLKNGTGPKAQDGTCTLQK